MADSIERRLTIHVLPSPHLLSSAAPFSTQAELQGVVSILDGRVVEKWTSALIIPRLFALAPDPACSVGQAWHDAWAHPCLQRCRISGRLNSFICKNYWRTNNCPRGRMGRLGASRDSLFGQPIATSRHRRDQRTHCSWDFGDGS